MLPQLTKPSTYTKEKAEVVNHFLGLNKGLNIGAGEFAAMHNMTNDYYPVFGNRKKRGIIDTLDNPMGVVGGDKLSYVDDDRALHTEILLRSRGVAASGFRPLCNIPHCCLP